jgi:hypothetical protein
MDEGGAERGKGGKEEKEIRRVKKKRKEKMKMKIKNGGKKGK